MDASVVRAAGETQHPTSSRCREFLLDILLICHRVVVSDDIMREWKKHASNYSLRWLAAMRSKGKIIHVVPAPSGLMVQIIECAEWEEKEIAAMQKDLLLILAALGADRIIASGDTTVHDLFVRAAVTVDSISSIVWVNPSREEDHCGEWLTAGARHMQELTLGGAG